MGLDMGSGSIRNTDDYWSLSWHFTFYKNSKLRITPVFKPWNAISIDVAHSRMLLQDMQTCFLQCVEELIDTVQAFYTKIDDIDNAVSLLSSGKQNHFSPDETHAIYWGNY